ncbi:hypothetical protein [Campylobacter concisus]|jgi:hypothetical protein|uniref:hypothetical protein n=1 Tax=Campylobacter concisus TaxID=199 RepID=UPI000CD8E9DA|nr:hypothetical protein [Campylobacter concisus]
MKKSKILIAGILTWTCGSNLYAFDASGALNGLINSGLSGLISSSFNQIDNATGNLIGQCYAPANSGSGDFDICSVVNQVGNIDDNICGLLPNVPGFTKKSKSIGLKGEISNVKNSISSYCSSKQKEFKDILASTQVEMLDVLSEKAKKNQKLPNGMGIDEFNDKWSDIKTVISQNKPSLFMTAIQTNNQDVLKLMRDNDRFKKSESINDIQMTDFGVAKNITEYNELRQNLANQSSNNKFVTLPSNISSNVAVSLKNAKVKGSAAQRKAQEITGKQKEFIEIAKANEISLALDVNRQKGDYALPIEEMVKIARIDKQPQIIAEMRDQQKREAYLIASINERWDKREALIDLLATKEVILNEPFDEASAKSEIESIVSGGWSGGSASAGGSNIGGGKINNFTNSILKN